jgi:hypothetical protein
VLIEPGHSRDRGATYALVLGLLSLPFGVLSPFAIVSGLRSRRRIRESRGALKGGAEARLGLAAGIASAGFLLLGIAYWLIAS